MLKVWDEPLAESSPEPRTASRPWALVALAAAVLVAYSSLLVSL
jgi:hypothetical protein